MPEVTSPQVAELSLPGVSPAGPCRRPVQAGAPCGGRARVPPALTPCPPQSSSRPTSCSSTSSRCTGRRTRSTTARSARRSSSSRPSCRSVRPHPLSPPPCGALRAPPAPGPRGQPGGRGLVLSTPTGLVCGCGAGGCPPGRLAGRAAQPRLAPLGQEGECRAGVGPGVTWLRIL